MIIQSKFHDYYDSVRSLGIDKSTVYRRETQDVYDDSLKQFHDLFHAYEITWTNVKDKRIYVRGLVFCGQPFIIVKKSDSMRIDHIYFNNADSFRNYITEELNRPYYWEFQGRREAVDEFLKKDWTQYHCKHKCPVFLIRFSRNNGEKPTNLVLNPNLKEREFFHVKDTFTCYQEIFSYLSGVMGDAGRPMVKTADKYKIQAAGFDLKSSFRKDTPPTRKQKKKVS